MAKMYVAEFTVEPIKGFAFPIDMLRYDSCFPATELDSTTILTSIHRDPVVQPVKLKKYVAVKNYATTLTPARWESFGWRIMRMHDVRELF